MKTRNLVLAVLLAATVLLAACSGSGIIEPEYGDPIPMKVGQLVEITNGAITAVVEYLGTDEFNQNQWSCVMENVKDCAERHSTDIENVQLFYQTERVGKTSGSNLLLAPGWEVKLYP